MRAATSSIVRTTSALKEQFFIKHDASSPDVLKPEVGPVGFEQLEVEEKATGRSILVGITRITMSTFFVLGRERSRLYEGLIFQKSWSKTTKTTRSNVQLGLLNEIYQE